MTNDDEGTLSMAIGPSKANPDVLVIYFEKRVKWIGLTVADATKLRDKLDEFIKERSSKH